MFKVKDMKEINEMFDQIESVLHRMRHMINAQSRCPMCGEPADGKCERCAADPRN